MFASIYANHMATALSSSKAHCRLETLESHHALFPGGSSFVVLSCASGQQTWSHKDGRLYEVLYLANNALHLKKVPVAMTEACRFLPDPVEAHSENKTVLCRLFARYRFLGAPEEQSAREIYTTISVKFVLHGICYSSP